MTTTPTGVENEAAQDMSSVEAFLNKWTDAGLLSETDEGANTDEESDETTLEDGDEIESDGRSEDEEDLDLGDEEDEDTQEEEADDQNAVEASDEAVVKIVVDGAEKKVAVKDLKRLYGQEASLTRKSQEVAEARKAAEDNGAKFVAASQKLLEKAQARYAPYAEIDWMVAQKTLTTSEFTALRREALEAHEDIQFLTEEVEGLMGEVAQARQAEMAEYAKESLKVLEEKVPNWSREHYDEIRQYAIKSGLTAEAVNSIIDPNAILLLRDAMLYSQAKERAKAKRKAAPSPRRVMKSTKGSGPIPNSRKETAAKAMSRLRETGSDEAAEAAFMSRWANED